jgi:hypothetical protein
LPTDTSPRGRPIALTLLLVLLCGLAAAAPAAGASAPGCTGARVVCDLDGVRPGGTVTEDLTGPLSLADLGDFQELLDAVGQRVLVVQVEKNTATGPGGSLLLELAAGNHRFVDPSSTVTRVDPAVLGRFTTAHQGCDALCGLLAQGDRHGKDLIGHQLANPSTPAPTKTGTTSPGKTSPKSGGGPGAGLVAGVAALLVLLLALLALAVRRSGSGRARGARTRRAEPGPPFLSPDGATRRTPAEQLRSPAEAPDRIGNRVPVPAARAARRPAQLLPATVGTDLHPQGYVAIDQCLYRAVWSDPAEPPPAPGGTVQVARPDPDDRTQDPDVLLAFPALPSDPQRRLHVQ